MKGNGIHLTPDGYCYYLAVKSRSGFRMEFNGGPFKTRLETAHAYVKAVLAKDPKAEYLQKLDFEEQCRRLGVKL